MVAYSIDLRQKILQAYERGRGSQRALAELFGVSHSVVEKRRRRQRETGALGPTPHAGGQRPRLDETAQAQVRHWVQAQPDATLEELCEKLAEARDVRVSVPTLCRPLQRLGLPRKKSLCLPASKTPSGSDRPVPTTTPR